MTLRSIVAGFLQVTINFGYNLPNFTRHLYNFF
jgi:hypothetical protein